MDELNDQQVGRWLFFLGLVSAVLAAGLMVHWHSGPVEAIAEYFQRVSGSQVSAALVGID